MRISDWSSECALPICDIIVGGNDNDIMSGDALAAGEGSIALANNTADGDVTEGQSGGGWFPAGAGNDMLGDGAEGYSGENGGDDVLAGDALEIGRAHV